MLSSHDGAGVLVSRVHTRLVLQGTVSTMLPPSLLQYVRSDTSAAVVSATAPEVVSVEHGHSRATLSARGAAPLSAAAAMVADVLTPCVHITGAALRVRASLLLQGPLGAHPPLLGIPCRDQRYRRWQRVLGRWSPNGHSTRDANTHCQVLGVARRLRPPLPRLAVT